MTSRFCPLFFFLPFLCRDAGWSLCWHEPLFQPIYQLREHKASEDQPCPPPLSSDGIIKKVKVSLWTQNEISCQSSTSWIIYSTGWLESQTSRGVLLNQGNVHQVVDSCTTLVNLLLFLTLTLMNTVAPADVHQDHRHRDEHEKDTHTWTKKKKKILHMKGCNFKRGTGCVVGGRNVKLLPVCLSQCGVTEVQRPANKTSGKVLSSSIVLLFACEWAGGESEGDQTNNTAADMSLKDRAGERH
ncbi:hypothetical protein INR49_017755 [Caranx melampygus]|nr:hypothetical protein INR49_017755 [Caranx melampygus]